MSKIPLVRALGAVMLSTGLFACGLSDFDGNDEPVFGTPATATARAPRCVALRGGAVASPEVVPVSLEGLFVVPAASTVGAGSGAFTVNRNTGELSGSITVSGFPGPASAVHIHSGFAGVNGEITVSLIADSAVTGKYNVPLGATLSANDLATLAAGGMYVDVHTAASPTGEIRGQILPGAIEMVRCEVTGDFEVPPITSDGSLGSGISYVTVNTSSGNLVANVRTTGFNDASAAHLHRAFAGLNGAAIVTLTQTGGSGTDLWEAASTLSGPDLAGFRAGEIYINVHTPANPNGYIRSQLMPKDISILRFRLNGAQEVPPVTTPATAVGYTTVDLLTGAIEANVRTSNVFDANAAHVHQGAATVEGDIVMPLAQPDIATPELWTGVGILSEAQLLAFLSDQIYLNVHTAGYPDGEIRGQIFQP